MKEIIVMSLVIEACVAGALRARVAGALNALQLCLCNLVVALRSGERSAHRRAIRALMPLCQSAPLIAVDMDKRRDAGRACKVAHARVSNDVQLRFACGSSCIWVRRGAWSSLAAVQPCTADVRGTYRPPR